MKSTDTYEFLSLFRNPGEAVIIGLLHESPTIKNEDGFIGVRYFNMPLEMLKQPLNRWVGFGYNTKFFIQHYNEKLGKAVYFIPNVGGRKNKDIKEIRSYFIDKDFAKVKEEFTDKTEAELRKQGLEKTGEFKTIEIEEDKKRNKYILRAFRTKEAIDRLKQEFLSYYRNKLKDAIINETYSGYHVYWLVSQASVKTFAKIQRALAKKFDSDSQVNNLARLMRVPGFYHQKYDEKFMVKVIQFSDKRFTEEEFIKMFHLERYFEQEKGFMKTEIQEPISYISPLKRSYNVVVEKGKSDLVFKTVPIKKLEEKTFNETLYHLLQEPLTSFIESPEMVEGKNIHCPFHDDSTPSGRVFKSDYGQMVYHCHACNVGTKNIIGLYMAHTNKNYRQSVIDLARIIGIKVVETEFEQEQFRKYRENRLYLEQDLETLFPHTAYFIEKYGRKSFLRYLNDKAETSVLKDEFQYKNENVFFVSFRAIAKEMNKKSMETVVRVVYLLNLLGFIERVPDQYVPEELRKRAEIEKRILQEELRQQGESGERRAETVRLINFYIVRNWNDIAFEIESIAKMMKEKKFTFNNLNKVGLIKMFGYEIANRVFPDERKVPKRFEKIAERLEKEVEKHIQEKSFAIMEEILKTQIRLKNDKGKQTVVPLAEKEDVFKRAILVNEKYQVSKVRSEKKKKQYGYEFSTPKTIHIITYAR